MIQSTLAPFNSNIYKRSIRSWKPAWIPRWKNRTIETSRQHLNRIMKELSELLNQTEKGIARQKLSLVYNVAEVCEQLLLEAGVPDKG